MVSGMSWSAALPKLQARLDTLRDTHGVKVVEAGEVRMQDDPFVYFRFVGYSDISQNRVQDHRYTIAIVVGTANQDAKIAETELAALVDAIPPLFYANEFDEEDNTQLATLNNTVTNSRLRSASEIRFSDANPYRSVRFELEITDKRTT